MFDSYFVFLLDYYLWEDQMNEIKHTVKCLAIVFAWVGIMAGSLMLYAVSNAGEQRGGGKFYTWSVIEVYDGDTFTVDEKFHPDELGNIKIRIRGIDTGELGYRAKCNNEAEKAQLAKEHTTSRLLGKQVVVANISPDKYGSRVVADVYIGDIKLADELIAKNLALPYDGGTKTSWCK